MAYGLKASSSHPIMNHFVLSAYSSVIFSNFIVKILFYLSLWLAKVTCAGFLFLSQTWGIYHLCGLGKTVLLSFYQNFHSVISHNYIEVAKLKKKLDELNIPKVNERYQLTRIIKLYSAWKKDMTSLHNFCYVKTWIKVEAL